jgi:hypothetical protein
MSEDLGSKQPDIVINGRQLSTGQAMTLRVALQSFLSDIAEPGSLGDDDHGRKMRELYRAHGSEINRIMGPERDEPADRRRP